MSYLETPRIHFSGNFSSDPSTVNNAKGNYNPATSNATLVANSAWNPNGKHNFAFSSCRVRSAVTSAGLVAADALIGGVVDLAARLVDIDPDAQTFSQLWGASVTVSLSAGGGHFSGKLKLCNIRDLWTERRSTAPFEAFGAVYQSVLEQVTFNTASRSPVFDALNTSASGVGNKLSIKFNVYAYDGSPASATFTQGKVTGTIGPFRAGEPEHFVAARKLRHLGAATFKEAPFIVDTARNKLVIDLGNAVPEDSVGARIGLGTMRPKIMGPGPVTLGPIDYSEAHYLTTAGVEEVPITAGQETRLASRALAIEVTAPATRLVLEERPRGSYVDVTDMVFRLFAWNIANMGPQFGNFADLEVFAAEFGRPKSGVLIWLVLESGSPAAALTFPANVTTGGNGRAAIHLSCGNPGSPRGAFLDGALYRIGVFIGAPLPSNLRATLVVRVFDEVAVVASPTWAHVSPIFRQYARLYPSMTSVFDLGNAAQLRPLLPMIKAALLRSEEARNYMPITRDLSPEKKAMIIRWIDGGAPGVP